MNNIIMFSEKIQAPHYSLKGCNVWDGTDVLGPGLILNSSILQVVSPNHSCFRSGVTIWDQGKTPGPRSLFQIWINY